MKFGVCLPNYGLTASYEAIRKVAVQADALGYDSLWTTDHLLVPEENRDPYGTVYESIVTLALLAEVARRVQIGTSILVLPMREPVLVAKQFATLDAATNGRVILGVGVGWNETEYRNLSADFKTRGRRLDEAIQLIRTIWSNEQVTFQGKYKQIADGYTGPQPAHKSIPIWIGGNGEPSWRRAARLGDGWHATGAAPEEIARGAQYIKELKPARPIAFSARLSIDFNPTTSPTYQYRGHTRYRLTGTPDAVRARLREYAQAGLEVTVLVFPWEDISVGLAQMEQFARELMPVL